MEDEGAGQAGEDREGDTGSGEGVNDPDKCALRGCKGKVEISYCGKGLCDKHWAKMCEKTPDEMKVVLGIKKEKDEEEKV
jgi:hypothetical protein